METTNNLLTQALKSLNKAKEGRDEYGCYLQSDLDHSLTLSLLVIAQLLNCLPEVLEEMKTTNHILASLYLDLKKLLPEDPGPQPGQSGIKLSSEIAYYVLGRSEYNENTKWKVEYKVAGYFHYNNIKSHGDWNICSNAFNTYADAVNYMNTLIHFHETHP